MNSVVGDGVSSYRTMSINNPPQLNAMYNLNTNGVMDNHVDSENQNSVVLHDSGRNMLQNTRETQYEDTSNLSQNAMNTN